MVQLAVLEPEVKQDPKGNEGSQGIQEEMVLWVHLDKGENREPTGSKVLEERLDHLDP